MFRKWMASLFLGAMLLTVSVMEVSAATPVIYWEGMKLVKGQIGKVEILKPTNLWKRENGKLILVRVLKPGEQYRVYSYDSLFGGQYGLGGHLYVTNIKGYIAYKTPSKEKLKLVNPELYKVKKLSLGTVMKESSTTVIPGVKKSELEVSSDRGKQHIYKLDINLQAENVEIKTGLSNEQVMGYETVIDQAKRLNREGHLVVGAVNGDYFDKNGAPVDLMVHNGEIITTNTTPVNERTIFGIDSNGKPMISNPDVSIEMTINGTNRHIIHSINKRRFAHHLVIYTPYFSSTSLTNHLGTEVVLTNLQGRLNGNGTLTGTVKEVIVGKGSAPLRPGEIVLSGHGEASKYLQQAKVGDVVDISINYDQAAWNGVQEAIGGRYRLVANGVVQTFNIAGAHPRTAIGIDKDGNVFTVVVDGRNPNHSNGVTLNELARLMKDFGAVDAMTFDGGGSSTFITRQPNGLLVVENKPSDGKPRPVANSLLIVYKGKTEEVQRLTIQPRELTVFAGATYKSLGLSVKGVTLLGQTVDVKQPLIWSSNAGTFLNDGSFVAAKQPLQGKITVSSGNLSGSINVNVVNDADQIVVQPKEIYIRENSSLPLNIQAFYKGREIVVNPNVFMYTVSNGLGKVENGIFKAANKKGTGKMTIRLGSKTVTIPVTVGIPNTVTLENFEQGINSWTASGARYVSVSVSLTNKIVKTGKSALKVAYDFSNTKGISGVYAMPKNSIVLKGYPKRIGMWVYGDAKGHWLRAQIKDGSGKRILLDFTKNVDWTGWKYVTADLPSGLTLPITLEMPVRYMEVNETNKNAGELYIDDIQAIYN
jgi:exopolysaccharide biosynthesis protein